MSTSPELQDSTQGYANEADDLAKQYESIAFADVHRDALHLIPEAPSHILDIGAGTGRDAAALARMGHRVLAVEPTADLRAHGLRLHADAGLEWLDDRLPGLERVLALGRRYELILLTAVWMHLDGAERDTAMAALSRLVANDGAVVMSLRHGPVPPGRRMFDVSAGETIALAWRHGLASIHQYEREDMLGRADIRWSFLAFRPDLQAT